MSNFSSIIVALLTILCCFSGCKNEDNSTNIPSQPGFISDNDFFDCVQKACFNYMWDGANPNTGMAYERIHIDEDYGGYDKSLITTGGSGFGIAGIIVAMDRGWITRQQGVERLALITNFLTSADRFHGVWPHWMHPNGKVAPFSTKDDGGDLVESCFLMEGLLCARQYLDTNVLSEKNIVEKINVLFRDMEFDWYTNNQDVLYWHWSPNYNWEMNFPLQGYNEALICYILAAASPTHSISNDCYTKGWARNGDIVSAAAPYGYALELCHNGAEACGGPLFWAHYSWFGLCPKGLSDQYANYWNVVKNHAMANYQYCVLNPKGYKNYGTKCWGLTASYSVDGYSAHAPNNDLGVITPTAALSSFPYTPEQSMAAMKNFYGRKTLLWSTYGFIDAFSDDAKWYPKRYLAIDQLTIAPMIENYRSGLLWKLFMSCPEIQNGLTKLGFTYTL